MELTEVQADGVQTEGSRRQEILLVTTSQRRQGKWVLHTLS